MPTKREVLEGVKSDIQTHGFVRLRYYDDVNKCCVVGHLLKRLGMEYEDIEKLRSNSTDEIMGNSPKLKDKQAGLKAKTLLVNAGFTPEELFKLQMENDEAGSTVSSLTMLLDELIAAEQR